MSILAIHTIPTAPTARRLRIDGPGTGPEPARPEQSVRLTRRGRLVLFVAALALVLAALVVWGPQVVATATSGAPVETTSVTVQPGQTLWDIAAEANAGGDIRDTVADIVDLNALPTSGDVQIGQQLAVPRS